MTAKLIDGKQIAAEIRGEVAKRVSALAERGITPGLATVLVGDDPASRVYVNSKRKMCAEVGIKAWDHDLEASTPEDQLLRLLEELGSDPAVHGILVQFT